MEKTNTFETLYNINLNDKTKEKIGLKYLSWAYAWAELKKIYPDAERIIYKRTIKTSETKTTKLSDGSEIVVVNEYENEIPYFTDGRTCTVKVGVKINGVEYIEELPVMDNKNHAIRLEAVTSTDVNKAIQRCFVKACALHGLGLYIYAGEDLPEVEKVVIDYNSLKDNMDLGAISEETFKQLQQETVGMLQTMNELDSTSRDEIFAYSGEVIPNKRVSLLTYPEDSVGLIKLHTFLKRLYGLAKK